MAVLLLLVLLLVLLFLLLHLLLLIMLPELQVVQKLINFMRLLLVCVQACMGTHHMATVPLILEVRFLLMLFGIIELQPS